MKISNRFLLPVPPNGFFIFAITVESPDSGGDIGESVVALITLSRFDESPGKLQNGTLNKKKIIFSNSVGQRAKRVSLSNILRSQLFDCDLT